MEINIENYLSETEIKEIVVDELRGQIRKFFGSESNTQRLLSNLSYHLVYDEIDKVVPNSRQLVIDKTTEILNDIKSYQVFRDGQYSGQESLAYQFIEQAVLNNKDLLNEKVKETIANKDYSKEIWDRYEEMAETFMSNFYEIARLGREKQS